MSLYLVVNGPMQTTAAFAGVSTGTSIKTMLQVKPFNIARIVEWGFSSPLAASNTGGTIELIETDVAATVTASVDADVTKFGPGVADQAAASVAGLTLSTTGTGYTSSGEGSVTAVRNLDLPQTVLAASQPLFYKWPFPLGREPIIQIGKFARVRVTMSGAAVTLTTYMVLDI